MKYILITITAVVLVGCGKSGLEEKKQSPQIQIPSISIHWDAKIGNIKGVKQQLAVGANVNAKWKGQTPLHLAAYYGSEKTAALLISSGADINAKHDETKETPLHSAILGNSKKVAELLIVNGANINAKDAENLTPLHLTPDHLKLIAELLISNGADINAKSDLGDTPLDMAVYEGEKEISKMLRDYGGKSGVKDSIYTAARLGNIEFVKKHLAAGKDVNSKTKSWNHTPLHWAVYGGKLDVVKLLISNGANINEKDRNGRTPLFSSVSSDFKEVSKLLISEGANVNAKSDFGTPLDMAIRRKQTQTTELLRKNGAMVIDEIKVIKTFKQHLKDGGDVNAKDDGEVTLLHKAALAGYDKLSKLLIDAGADINVKTKSGNTPLHKGETPLHLAAKTGRKDIISLLIIAGANVNSKDKFNETPLDQANRRNQVESSKILRKHGGKTIDEISIHSSAIRGNIEAVKQHLAAGVDLNSKNNYGMTPLHEATRSGHKEIVKMLIAKGADINAKNDNGKTPLDWAKVEIAVILRKHGAKTARGLKAEGK